MVNHPRRSMTAKFYAECDKVARLQHALADAVFEAEWLIGHVAEWDGADLPNLKKKVARWKALSNATLPSEWTRAAQEHGAPMRRGV